MLTRAYMLLGFMALTNALACDDCTWFTPDASRERRIGTHVVEVTAVGTRRFGVDGVGAPHAFGILWPTIDGYGYLVRVEIDDRPVIDLGAARFAGERMPTEEELQTLADAVEVTFSPDDQHFAYRKDRVSGWRTLHLLSRGKPFDSEKSDVFARQIVEQSALDFSSLPTSRAIGLAILRDPQERHARHAFWDALTEEPAGPPWDDALLEIWPEESRTQALLEARVAPRGRSAAAFKAKVLQKALAALRGPLMHVEAAANVIIASEDAAALRTLDDALAELYPQAGIARSLIKRLEATHGDASRAAFRTTARDKALGLIREAQTSMSARDRMQDAIHVVQAAEHDEDAPVLFATLMVLWPESEQAHEWLSSHHGRVPPDVRGPLLAKARAHAQPGNPHEHRAAGMACYLLRDTRDCAEIRRLSALNRSACEMPTHCR